MEDAIAVTAGLRLDLLPENRDGETWTTVYEGAMRECAGCGKPFASEGTASKIESEVGERVAGLTAGDENVFDYCADCRVTLLHGGDR